jgi:hypothetical protein
VLVQIRGRYELRTLPDCKEHNQLALPKTQTSGFESLGQRQGAMKLLRSTLVTTPDTVLRSMRLDEDGHSKGLSLKQLQNLKKDQVRSVGMEELGDLAHFVAQHSSVPDNDEKG